MKEGRRAFKTNRNTTVMFGLDNADISVFGAVGFITYIATDVTVGSIVLKAVVWGIVGFLTWSVWFRIKDEMQPKIILHLLGWHAAPDLLEVRPTTTTPIPLVVNLPDQKRKTSQGKRDDPPKKSLALMKETS